MLLGKKKDNEQVFIVLNQRDEIFNIPKINDDKTQEFDSQRKLEQDEWFFINLSNYRNIIQPFTYTDTSGFNNLEGENLSGIACLFEKQTKHYLFQRITPKKIIEKKKFLILEGNPKIQEIKNSICLEEKIDACYKTKEKRLYFKSFQTIKPIFKGIEVFYRIATEEDINKFKDVTKIQLEFQVGDRNKKIIATLMDGGFIFKHKKKYQDYAKKYDIDFDLKNIQNNKDLTRVLGVLSESYYETPITHKKKLSERSIDIRVVV